VLCKLGDIRPGITVPLTISFNVGSMTGNQLVNHIVVRESRKDPDPTNDRATVTTAFVP
jgi:hypothetical protein